MTDPTPQTEDHTARLATLESRTEAWQIMAEQLDSAPPPRSAPAVALIIFAAVVLPLLLLGGAVIKVWVTIHG
ncbi:MAG TPA: hypothetical protein VD903_11915 [Pseudonocardia sp.]|nr:hypothetical protein [Pseudonocardia sp.]